ncbi:MAG: hypothetical protein ACJ75F_03765 [Flavisolibacter sp.]|jgi:hypothetical protein
MKIIHLVFIIFSFLFTACNLERKLVKNSYAYTSIRMPGTLAVDQNGKPIHKGADTSTLIFVETAREGIIWEKAWMDNKSFIINPVAINNIPLELGHKKTTGEPVVLAPGKDNQFWQLLLKPSDNPVSTESLKEGEILLQGRYKNKKFTKKITDITELLNPDAQ